MNRTAQKGVEVAQEIVDEGFEAIALQGDVSSEADIRRVVAETISRYGKIDVLVNNAAVCP